jgi:prepilin-type N-terminal cleavage/methylation domain-containing protein
MANNRSFTLVEMMVAVAIFASVATAVSMLFVSAIRAQRQSLALQELLDQTSYVMEYMSRTIRMAKKDMTGLCTGSVKLNYYFDGQCLKFKNYKGECQQFCLEGPRLKEIKDDVSNYLTSPELTVSSFDVSGDWSWNQPPTDYLQPLVTISLEIEGKEQSKIQIQTSLSQRDLDVMK